MAGKNDRHKEDYLEEKDLIRLVYNITSKGKEILVSIEYNDKAVYFSKNGSGIEKKMKQLNLDKSDKLVLERRPLQAILSIGHFKLNQDIAENVSENRREYSIRHYLRYERM